MKIREEEFDEIVDCFLEKLDFDYDGCEIEAFIQSPFHEKQLRLQMQEILSQNGEFVIVMGDDKVVYYLGVGDWESEGRQAARENNARIEYLYAFSVDKELQPVKISEVRL